MDINTGKSKTTAERPLRCDLCLGAAAEIEVIITQKFQMIDMKTSQLLSDIGPGTLHLCSDCLYTLNWTLDSRWKNCS